MSWLQSQPVQVIDEHLAKSPRNNAECLKSKKFEHIFSFNAGKFIMLYCKINLTYSKRFELIGVLKPSCLLVQNILIGDIINVNFGLLKINIHCIELCLL